ncbi:putative aminomethyltransferase [Serinicoccus hydrothermalis]|uniref:Putative aminomethyltransferase n=1 Tax=Serinicoccus hydrothermalis TaxID=1758689 RepID=A0A1B1NE82_9MICO|nr:aminomethyltransferase family protein [Serinicoccus hydrothermalis]ANS79749.1 putative aminomethyltransferase [Serinicoccus hydrothermalis]
MAATPISTQTQDQSAGATAPDTAPTNHNHPTVQQGRSVPVNLRQTGPTPVELLISTRIRKSPYWHLSVEAGVWRAEVYNRVYHPRGYLSMEEGGPLAEHKSVVNDVTLWNVAVERQIQVKGPDAEDFVNYVITRQAKTITPMHARYVILCNEAGGILNDPVLLRISEDEFWFSLSDSSLMFWLQGVNISKGYDVTIDEIDVCPVQIQGPKSEALMRDLIGPVVSEIPNYGLAAAEVAGLPVIVSQTGFTGEKGYEIYLYDATLHAEEMWNAVLEAGEAHNLRVIAPAHPRRVQAGILSWGQDMDSETSPLQTNLAYQVPRLKEEDYIGKAALEAQREQLEAGSPPFELMLVGLRLGGKPITDYAPDFWLVSTADSDDPVGYLTSPWYSPELETNIALGYVPWGMSGVGTQVRVWLPEQYADTPGEPVDATIVDVPFRPSVNPNTREVLKEGQQSF